MAKYNFLTSIGSLLGVGLTDGCVYILDALSLNNERSEPFQYAKDAITDIAFSHDSRYLATVVSIENILKSNWNSGCRNNLIFFDHPNRLYTVFFRNNFKLYKCICSFKPVNLNKETCRYNNFKPFCKHVLRCELF